MCCYFTCCRMEIYRFIKIKIKYMGAVVVIYIIPTRSSPSIIYTLMVHGGYG